MKDWQIPIIISLPELAGCWSFHPAEKHKVIHDQKVEVLYGYPANRPKKIATIYHYRKTGRWHSEWMILFAEKRPKSWGDIKANA
ncbi:hypothetical protein O5623_07495 [Escherichia coli]|nr:hypothetical protein [Escherichia coli]